MPLRDAAAALDGRSARPRSARVRGRAGQRRPRGPGPPDQPAERECPARPAGTAVRRRAAGPHPPGTTLTPAGEAVVTWAHGVIDAAGALADGVASLRAGQQARLRVAASLTVAEHLLPGWLLTLRRHHPDLEISASVANSAEVCATVRAGRADLGFVETPDLPHDLSRQEVGHDRPALVVAARYPLAARGDGGLRARDLVEQPLLLREVGSGTRTTFLYALGEALGAVPTLRRVSDLGSTSTILATVRAGGGVGVVSARGDRTCGCSG